MKFCQYCGKQLEDNALCDCATAVQLRTANQTEPQPQPQAVPEQPVEPQPQPQAVPVQPIEPQPQVTFEQPVQTQEIPQQQYVAPQQMYQYAPVQPQTVPKKDNKFVEALKSIPEFIKSYIKDAKATTDKAKSEKNVILSAIFSGIFFIALLIFNCLMFASINLSVSGIFGGYYNAFRFFEIFATSLVLAVIIGAFYVLVSWITKVIFVKNVNHLDCIVDSYVEYSANSLFVSAILIVAGIFSLFLSWLSALLIIIAVVYMLNVLITSLNSQIKEVKHPTLYPLLKAVFISVAVVIIVLVVSSLFMWCTGVDSAINTLSNFGSAFSDFSNFY
jgi:hypothetical protein